MTEEKEKELKRQYAKKQREFCAKNNLCLNCKKPNYTGNCLCEDCAKKESKRRKENRSYYISVGICPTCKKNRLFGEEKTCLECKAKKANYYSTKRKDDEFRKHEYELQSEWRKRKTEECIKSNLCTRCRKREPANGRKMCNFCLARMRKYKADEARRNGVITREFRFENGLCYFCADPVVDGLKVCEKCRERLKKTSHSENAAKARKKMKEEGRGFYKAI